MITFENNKERMSLFSRLQVRRVGEAKDNMGFEHIMALNKNGVSFLDQITHETLIHYPFTEVILNSQRVFMLEVLKTKLNYKTYIIYMY